MSLELLRALSGHLGAGRLDSDRIAALAAIDRLCPDEARHPGPARLYRGITIGKPEFERLRAGDDIRLEPRDHDCWSRSDTAIRMLMRIRAGQHEDMGACLLLRRDFGPGEIAVDFELLARHLGMDQADSRQWHNYVLPEKEIIVRNEGGAVTIRPEHVLQAWHGEMLARLWEPVRGEAFLDPDMEEHVVDEFLGVDDYGNMRVRADGRIFQMDCHDGFWCVTAELSEKLASPEMP